MRCLKLLIVLVLLSASASAQPASQRNLPCEMPQEYITPTAPLPSLGRALAEHRPLNILAIGSGSTVGETGGANGPAFAGRTPGASFPFRMAEALRNLRPGLRVNLTVAGGRNMTADDMLPILNQHLATHRYDLVLWQTGTVEAVRGLRPEMLRDTLDAGITAATDKHTDVIQIDPQFSRFLRANVDLEPYEWVLQQMADHNDVGLFRRFALTQTWVNNGEIDLERVSRDGRDKTVALLNSCLGQALAEYILAAESNH